MFLSPDSFTVWLLAPNVVALEQTYVECEQREISNMDSPYLRIDMNLKHVKCETLLGTWWTQIVELCHR